VLREPASEASLVGSPPSISPKDSPYLAQHKPQSGSVEVVSSTRPTRPSSNMKASVLAFSAW
jgi:hypothetical protein